ncbi:MAG: hypothetical protein GXP58_11575 [Deltaproteobacteria bacterium]|nr:hypothetical protein [Deltaproteobacteria bacterium]
MQASEEEKELHRLIREALKDGRLSCAEAFRIAGERNISLQRVGEACNQLGIKINHCRLGCFP